MKDESEVVKGNVFLHILMITIILLSRQCIISN